LPTWREQGQFYNKNNDYYYHHHHYYIIIAAARFKTWVCDRSLAGIAGSNRAGGMDACLLLMLCV
jgi:hypothetical protein